jgi:GDP-4-dehydro-6-deoxy-D-mannose reductase
LKRALVTGISGFVGPYLAAYLQERHVACAGLSHGPLPSAHPVHPKDLHVYDVDIRDRKLVRSALEAERPDYVFHLAAITRVPSSRTNPELVFDVNVTGTFNLFESLRQLSCPARVVFVSSGSVYGNVDSGDSGFSEESPVHVTSPYVSSKIIGEQLVHSYVGDFGLDIVIARPFNHTGPGQAPSFVASEFARDIAEGKVRGERIQLETGHLEPRRDLSDVRDVVRAYALLAECGVAGEVYNVCSGSMVSMGEVLHILETLARVSVTTRLNPAKLRDREIMRSGGSYSKIHALGWEPKIALTDTLRDLLNYWQNALDDPDSRRVAH